MIWYDMIIEMDDTKFYRVGIQIENNKNILNFIDWK